MVCVYLVNNNPFYMFMVIHSIHMLRQFNEHIPIRLFFVQTESKTPFDHVFITRDMFLKVCNRLNVEVVEKDQYDSPEKDFFFMNKVYMTECSEDQLLFIDGDTFISGDVEKLFEYKNDLVACENRWVYSMGWENDWLDIVPMNGGVLLFNDGKHRQLFSSLADVCKELRTEKHGLAKWIQTGRLYNREEFGMTLLAQRMNFNCGIFDKSDAYNVQQNLEIQPEVARKSLIFHTYAAQWLELYRKMKKPVKKPKLVKNARKTDRDSGSSE